jgi:hypothetical protein
MAKNRTMRIMIIRSENFLLFMTHAHPFSLFHIAFSVPREQQKGKASLNNPAYHELSNNFIWLLMGRLP